VVYRVPLRKDAFGHSDVLKCGQGLQWGVGEWLLFSDYVWVVMRHVKNTDGLLKC